MANGAVYGALYNFYVISDPRGIAPTGYHVPTKAEWITLSHDCGGSGSCVIRQTGTTLWQAPNWRASNLTGFTALPGGERFNDGRYGGIKEWAAWWSSTNTIDGPVFIDVDDYSAKIDCGEVWYIWHTQYGISLRFFKNK